MDDSLFGKLQEVSNPAGSMTAVDQVFEFLEAPLFLSPASFLYANLNCCPKLILLF